MTPAFARVFGPGKPVIAMVHLGALPGTPLYDADAGVEGIIEDARADLDALQAAGVDAVMFGNENDRPYELRGGRRVDRDDGLCHRAAARRDHGAVRGERAVGPARDAWRSRRPPAPRFVREIFTGTYASDMGLWAPGRGRAPPATAGCVGAGDVVTAVQRLGGVRALARRSQPARPGALGGLLVGARTRCSCPGAITGEAAAMSDLEAVKRVLPDDARCSPTRA